MLVAQAIPGFILDDFYARERAFVLNAAMVLHKNNAQERSNAGRRYHNKMRLKIDAVITVHIQSLSNIRSRVESRYDIQCLIRRKGGDRLALVNTRTSFWRMLLLCIMIQSAYEKRDRLNN